MSVTQVSGLVSGLDTKTLIDALITARSRPLTLLQANKDQKTAELAAWNSFEATLLALKVQSDQLSDKTLWDRMNVATSDADHLSVDAASGATTGTWSLFVQNLATTHQVESQAYASRDTAVGAGTFAITTSGGTTNLSVSSGTTLGQLADLVNRADLGVTATVVRSQAAGVESFHLMLTANESGEANRFSVVTSGLSGGVAPTFATTQTGTDAVVRFGGETGTEIRSSTNVFKDLIDGVDVTVTKAHAAGEATDFTIGRDTSGIEAAVSQFVDSYNSMIDFVNKQYAYDPNVGTVPPLFGDASLTSIAGDLRSRVLQPVVGTEGATFRTLQAIGLSLDGDGKLSLDTGAFENAMKSDFGAVANLFRTNATSTDAGVQWLSAPSGVSLAGRHVDVQVTQAATRATLRGDAISLAGGVTIDDTNDSFRIEIDGTLSENLHVAHGTYTSGDALARAISSAIDQSTTLGAATVGVSFEPDGGAGGRLVFTSARWGAKGTVKLQTAGSSFASAVGLTTIWNVRSQGVDVAGTVNGTAATGNGRTLTVPNDTADIGGMSFLVTAESVGGTSLDAGVTFTEGFARSVGRQLASLTDSANGTIARLGKSIQTMIDGYASDIQDKQDELDRKRASLEQQYAQLESTLQQLTNQGNFVSAQIQSLYGTTGGGFKTK
ncbi:MAG: flagellar filament capping protein FliD [bacterium]